MPVTQLFISNANFNAPEFIENIKLFLTILMLVIYFAPILEKIRVSWMVCLQKLREDGCSRCVLEIGMCCPDFVASPSNCDCFLNSPLARKLCYSPLAFKLFEAHESQLCLQHGGLLCLYKITLWSCCLDTFAWVASILNTCIWVSHCVCIVRRTLYGVRVWVWVCVSVARMLLELLRSFAWTRILPRCRKVTLVRILF